MGESSSYLASSQVSGSRVRRDAFDARAKIAMSLYFFGLGFAPFLLGANRGWAWPLILIFVFVGWLIDSGRNSFSAWKEQPVFLASLALLAIIPLIQIIPLPSEIVGAVSPGRLRYLASTQGEWLELSLDKGSTVDALLLYFGYLISALLALSVFRSRSARTKFGKLLVLVGFANAVLGFINFYTDGALAYFRPGTWVFDQGVTGSYVNKNHFAGLMQICIPFAVIGFLFGWSRRRVKIRAGDLFSLSSIGQLVALVTLIAALVASGSRGGLLSLLASLMLTIGFVHSGNATAHLRRFMTLGLVLLTLATIVVLVVGLDALNHVYLQKGGADLRVRQWIESLAGLPFFIALGSGADTYLWFYAPLKSPGMSNLIFDHAHNDYLEFAVTLGLPGFLAFLTMILFSLARALSCLRRVGGVKNAPLLFAASWGAISLAIHSFVDFNLQIPANALLFVALLSFCLAQVSVRCQLNH